MLKLFHRTPTASQMGKLGNQVKAERARAAYIEFHDKLAAKCGRKIEWAE